MKVLLHSYAFWPSLGGIEVVSDVLAENLVKLGHSCVVVTETPLGDQPERDRPYAVVRQPGWRRRLSLARQSDIVHANGATMAMALYARAAGVPFVWTHNGYQVSCVDGLGWAYGGPAPMTPWASLAFHRQRRGWRFALREAVKLGLRRRVAQHVDLNLAGSLWVARRQPLPRQSVTYNPYPLARFRAARDMHIERYDFGYVGRLVSEKGLPTLVHALHRLVADSRFAHCRLAVVGGGDMRPELEALVQQLQLQANVDFLGPRQGDEVVAAMAQARVGVVPSAWEEPYGGVTLEWLSAGKGVIVSEQGGHAECAADAGLRFRNGDVDALHACLRAVMTEPGLVPRLQQAARLRVEAFSESRLTQNYIDHYQLAIDRRRPGAAPAAASQR